MTSVALRWVLWVIAMVTSPLWLPVLFVAFATEVAFLPGEWHVWRRMRRAGRWLPRGELFERLRMRSGTLIVEWPTPGFRFSRVWWTPEIIGCPAQEVSEHDRVTYYERCHARYTDLERGAALLVSVWWGEWALRRLEHRFP